MTAHARLRRPGLSFVAAALAFAGAVFATAAPAQDRAYTPGTWHFTLIQDGGGSPECVLGRLFAEVMVARDGRMSGFMNDAIVGSFDVSGTVLTDGTLDVVANGLDLVDI